MIINHSIDSIYELEEKIHKNINLTNYLRDELVQLTKLQEELFSVLIQSNILETPLIDELDRLYSVHRNMLEDYDRLSHDELQAYQEALDRIDILKSLLFNYNSKLTPPTTKE